MLPETCANSNQKSHLAQINLEGLVLNKTIIVLPCHKAITTSLVGLVVSAAKERLSAALSSLDNKISVIAAVAL